MKIVYIILCRLSSKRLPGKMMMHLGSKPILWYSYSALSEFAGKENVVVATSQDSSDDAIAEFCESNAIQLYRGDLDNVALRFKEASEAYPSDYVVRICGDNVFVSHQLLSETQDMLSEKTPDFMSNTPGRTYPYGMSIEAIKPELYSAAYEHFEMAGDFEHVMPYFYRNQNSYHCEFLYNESCPEAVGKKLAVDEMSDFLRVEKMLSMSEKEHYKLTMSEIVDLYHLANNELHQ